MFHPSQLQDFVHSAKAEGKGESHAPSAFRNASIGYNVPKQLLVFFFPCWFFREVDFAMGHMFTFFRET